MTEEKFVSKQDKRVKKEKAAAKRAKEIVENEVSKIKAKAPASASVPDVGESPWDSERREGITDEQWALGVRCRELREQGEPWWAIARDMELQGWGNSATEGKKGAARARTVYKTAFGEFPRTFQTGRYKGPVERNERVKALRAQKKADRLKVARAGEAVITAEIPDEEVAAMLKGRRIRWFSDAIIPEGREYEACIHPHTPLYIEGEGDDRVIEFREQHRKAPVAVRAIPAQTRTVRLRQIFYVK